MILSKNFVNYIVAIPLQGGLHLFVKRRMTYATDHGDPEIRSEFRDATTFGNRKLAAEWANKVPAFKVPGSYVILELQETNSLHEVNP